MSHDVVHLATVAANEAVSQVLNSQAPDLPPLAWRLWGRALSGQVDAFGGDAVEAVLSRWAGRFSLAPTPAMPGTAEYSGMVGGAAVSVWGVVDGAAWDKATA